MRARFDSELKLLNTRLIEMGGAVETAFKNARAALSTLNARLADATVKGDADINRRQLEIEGMCLKLLLHEQPVAGDLRLILASIQLVSDLERVGDQAQDIAEIALRLTEYEHAQLPARLNEMMISASAMLTRALDAYVRRDVALAKRVISDDDGVDELFLSVWAELSDILRVSPERAREALDMLMIAKYTERVADHAVNVSEWVEFISTGIYKGEKLN